MTGLPGSIHRLDPTYVKRAAALRARARANPQQRCAYCGLLLHEHPHHRKGQPPHWVAGHADGGHGYHPSRIGAPLAVWASTCNARDNVMHTNAKRHGTPPPPPTPRGYPVRRRSEDPYA